MSDPRAEFLDAIGLTQDVLMRIASSVEQFLLWFRRCIEDALPALPQFVAALQRIEQSPPVAGYESFLIKKGFEPIMARLLARNFLRLGAERLKERQAERNLASAVYALVAAGKATPLVISRRARAIAAALDNGMALPSLRAACAKARIPETEYSIQELVERATRRDAIACSRLIEICPALKPNLVNPRGLTLTKATATHEVALHFVKQAYTYDSINNVFKDPASQATSIAMNIKKFDPRPALRRFREKEKGRS
jgi:hypothetical protein